MEEKHSEKLAVLKSYIENMPTFSPATKKVIELANDLDASANEIIKAVRMDPVLTGKVLQLVNSAYFSLQDKVTSLNRAVVYIGINTIKNIALSSAMVEALNSKNQEIEAAVQPIWKHSLATAVCAKAIAKTLQIPKNQIEEYFIVGLMHDLGKITLVQCFHENSAYHGQMSIVEEKASFGLGHHEVGHVILKKWAFDKSILEAVKGHHSPKSEDKLAYSIHLADVMTYRLDLNTEKPLDEEKQQKFIAAHPIAEETWDKLATTEEAILAGLTTVKDEIAKAEVFLNG